MKTLTKRRAVITTIVEIPPGTHLDRDAIWTTREKRRVPVKMMTRSHLLNTIRVLQGKSPHGTVYRCSDRTRAAWVNLMLYEALSRGLIFYNDWKKGLMTIG